MLELHLNRMRKLRLRYSASRIISGEFSKTRISGVCVRPSRFGQNGCAVGAFQNDLISSTFEKA